MMWRIAMVGAGLRRLLGAVLALALAAGGVAADDDGGGRLRVLATVPPLYCFAVNVAGGHADVEQLLPPSRGPHDFSFSPSDMRKLSRAEVVVMNGLGLEEWLDDAIGALDDGPLRIVDTGAALDPPALDGTPRRIAPADGSQGAHRHGRGDDHGHCHADGGVNPHVWLDPQLAMRQVDAIADGLAAADPANAAAYRANAAAYKDELARLDARVAGMLAGLPDKRIITFHDAFPYYAARYAIEVVGVFQVFPGREPTPKRIAELRALITDQGVRALFAEPQYSPKLLESMAADLDVPVGVLDPMGTGEPSSDFYSQVALANAAALVDALSDG